MKAIGKIWKIIPPWARTRLTRLYSTTFTVSVAAVITNNEGEVLLLDHYLRPASGWGIPGGFINPGEQPEDAIRRELIEETGIELSEITLLRTRTLKRHVEILYVARASASGEVKSSEIRELRWFSPSKLPPEMSRQQRSLIGEVLAGSG